MLSFFYSVAFLKPNTKWCNYVEIILWNKTCWIPKVCVCNIPTIQLGYSIAFCRGIHAILRVDLQRYVATLLLQHDQILACAEFVQRFECLSCGLTSLWVPSGASASDEEAGGGWRFTLEEMKETKVPIPRWPLSLYIVTQNDLREPAYNLYVCQRAPPSACFEYLTVAHSQRHTAHCGAFRRTGEEERVCRLSKWAFPLSVWHMTK